MDRRFEMKWHSRGALETLEETLEETIHRSGETFIAAHTRRVHPIPACHSPEHPASSICEQPYASGPRLGFECLNDGPRWQTMPSCAAFPPHLQQPAMAASATATQSPTPPACHPIINQMSSIQPSCLPQHGPRSRPPFATRLRDSRRCSPGCASPNVKVGANRGGCLHFP